MISNDLSNSKWPDAISHTKATAILQGRLGSSRLPGKVLLPLAGKPAMQHVYERILHCRRIDRVIVATSVEKQDDPIADLFNGLGVPVFRGSEADPLDRFYRAATKYNLNHVVRVMADCPLVDPEVVDAVIATYFAGNHDFCCLEGEFPVGLDTTVYSYAALKRSWLSATSIAEREHIFPYITNHPEFFSIGAFKFNNGAGHLRWTMDHPSDYIFIKEVYEALYNPAKLFLSQDVIDLLDKNAQLAHLNSSVRRDEGIQKAMEMDRPSSPCKVTRKTG